MKEEKARRLQAARERKKRIIFWETIRVISGCAIAYAVVSIVKIRCKAFPLV